MRTDFLLEPGVGSTLLVALTSYGNGHGTPAPENGFEWRHFLSRHACHKAFLIDSQQHWFLGPICGFSSGLGETVARIRRHREELGATRTIVLGSSMGGFGALLIGGHIEADAAIAIAPQTCLEERWLTSISDFRWQPKTDEIKQISYRDLDILSQFGRGLFPKRSLVFFDSSCILDRHHALRLKNSPGLELFDLGYGGHNDCAYEMVKRGDLDRVLRTLTPELSDLSVDEVRPRRTSWAMSLFQALFQR